MKKKKNNQYAPPIPVFLVRRFYKIIGKNKGGRYKVRPVAIPDPENYEEVYPEVAEFLKTRKLGSGISSSNLSNKHLIGKRETTKGVKLRPPAYGDLSLRSVKQKQIGRLIGYVRTNSEYARKILTSLLNLVKKQNNEGK